MLRSLRQTMAVLSFAAVLVAAGTAQASSVTLDFDSAATGSDIVAAPLNTALGTIAASASAGSTFFGVFSGGTTAGFAGNGLFHSQAVEADYAQLAFDFDVSAISFIYAGYVAGALTAQALDLAFNVVDSFVDVDTNADAPSATVTLRGSGIRYFRFTDAPSSFATVGIDDVVITGAVPVPATPALVALGLAGLAAQRRRR